MFSNSILQITLWNEMLHYAVMLFAISNPIGNAFIFLSMTSSYTSKNRYKIARSTSIAVFIILSCMVWFGEMILNFFGISIAAFRISGGILVTLIGLSLLGYIHISSHTSNGSSNNIAIVPLAIPIIAGPGSIVTTMAAVHNTFNTIPEKFLAWAVVLIITFIIWATLHFSSMIFKLIGDNGVNIFCKVMGLILVAMAIQMILEGCLAIFPAWG